MRAKYDETRRLLAHVCARMGGAEEVGVRLGISPRLVVAYMTGEEPVPDTLILPVVDLLLADLEESKKADGQPLDAGRSPHAQPGEP